MGFLLNAGQALTQQNTYSPTVGVQGQQNDLATALLNQSKGMGPNPVQQQYLKNTNQQIAQTAGQIGSQKGISPALAQKLIAESSGATRNAQAGGAATLQAQQQLGSQQQLSNVYGQIGNEQLGLSAQNTQISGQNAAAANNTTSGLLGGIATGAAAFLNKGGPVLETVQKFDTGGGVNGYQALLPTSPEAQILHSAGVLQPMNPGNGGGGAGNQLSALGTKAGASYQDNRALNDLNDEFDEEDAAAIGGGGNAGSAKIFRSSGGPIPEHLQHIARIYHPGFESKQTEQLKSKGGDVPGKAPMKGDSPKNDIVPTMLSPGETVIPKSVMESDDPVKNAAKFVANELRKREGNKEEGTPEEFKKALKKAIGSRKAA